MESLREKLHQLRDKGNEGLDRQLVVRYVDSQENDIHTSPLNE